MKVLSSVNILCICVVFVQKWERLSSANILYNIITPSGFTNIIMATHISKKMNTHLPILREAVDGSTDLRSNQKLYKKSGSHKIHDDKIQNAQSGTTLSYFCLHSFFLSELATLF